MTKLSVKQPGTTSTARQATQPAAQPASGQRSGEAGASAAVAPSARPDEPRPVQAPVQDAVSNEPQAEQARVTGRATGPAQDARLDKGKALGMTGLLAQNRQVHARAATRTTPGTQVAAPAAPGKAAEVAADPASTLRRQIEANRDPVKTTRGAAERLHAAIKGWGTNEAEIFRTLGDRSQAEIALIRKDYQARTGTSLDAALADELGGKDLERAQLLLQGNDRPSPERDAQLLDAAMREAGTDEKLVLDTLHGKSDAERQAIAKAYQQRTGRSLASDLDKEHSGRAKVFALATLKRGGIDDADRIHASLRGPGNDKEALFKTLEGKTPEQLAELQNSYHAHYGRDLRQELNSELSGKDLFKARQLLARGHLEPADQLKLAMVGAGTDERAIKKVFEGTSPEQRQAIVADYRKRHGDLDRDLAAELSGHHLAEVKSLMQQGALSPAEKLNRAFRGMGTDEDAVMQALDGLSPEQLRETKADYARRYGGSLEDEIRSEMSGKEQDKALRLLERGHLSLAEQLHFATAGTHPDAEAAFAALEKASPQDRAALDDAFKAAYGTTARERLQSAFGGRDRRQAELLLQGGPLSPRQRAELALQGAGTREKDLFAALGAASPEERAALRADPAFTRQLDAELGATDRERAQLLLDNGRLTREEQLHFAMAGLGTDEAAVREALRDLGPAERQDLRARYQARYGRALDDDLRSELGKRDAWMAEDALAPEPETLRERLDRAEQRAARERDSGGAVGTASDAMMDLFTKSGLEVEHELRELRRVAGQAAADPARAAELAPRLQAGEQAVEARTAEYLAEKEQVARTVGDIATMTTAAAVTAVTGGMGAPAAMALIAATAGATKVASRHLVMGTSYDLLGQDGAVDFATGAAEGLSNYLSGKAGDKVASAIGRKVLEAQGRDLSARGMLQLGRQALRESGGKATRASLQRASEGVLRRAGYDYIKANVGRRLALNAVLGGVQGAVAKAPTAAVRTALDERTSDMEFGDAVRHVLRETGKASARSARDWAVGSAAFQVGAIAAESATTYAKLKLGEQLARGQVFGDKELLKAGYQALGSGAKEAARDQLLAAGQRKLLLDMAEAQINSTAFGRVVQKGASELITYGTAVHPRTLFDHLGNHETWEYGMDGALETMLTEASKAGAREAVMFGSASLTSDLARKLGGRPADAARAGVSQLVWRAIGTIWR